MKQTLPVRMTFSVKELHISQLMGLVRRPRLRYALQALMLASFKCAGRGCRSRGAAGARCCMTQPAHHFLLMSGPTFGGQTGNGSKHCLLVPGHGLASIPRLWRLQRPERPTLRSCQHRMGQAH